MMMFILTPSAIIEIALKFLLTVLLLIDSSGIINFMEFVASIWNLLTLPHDKLGSLFFLLIDKTGTKKILCKPIRRI